MGICYDESKYGCYVRGNYIWVFGDICDFDGNVFDFSFCKGFFWICVCCYDCFGCGELVICIVYGIVCDKCVSNCVRGYCFIDNFGWCYKYLVCWIICNFGVCFDCCGDFIDFKIVGECICVVCIYDN